MSNFSQFFGGSSIIKRKFGRFDNGLIEVSQRLPLPDLSVYQWGGGSSGNNRIEIQLSGNLAYDTSGITGQCDLKKTFINVVYLIPPQVRRVNTPIGGGAESWTETYYPQVFLSNTISSTETFLVVEGRPVPSLRRIGDIPRIGIEVFELL